jgi:(1->4)-alpha-D-glucan 1-alpha-D-glucosylmutase
VADDRDHEADGATLAQGERVSAASDLLADGQLAQFCRDVVEQTLHEIGRRRHIPRATYRFQFHSGCRFRDCASVAPYVRSLGVSHIYASPVLRARPGSEHGYDVCNHLELDPELGGEDGWRELVEKARQNGLRMILDFVPNHMSTHWSNPWWTDVLENGPSSPFARYFDIDWHPITSQLDHKVLLPVLGKQYGDALEEGELRVEYADGSFFVRYFEALLPMDPKSTALILGERLDELRAALSEAPEAVAEYESILTALSHLPPNTATASEAVAERQRDKEVIKRRLRELAARSEIVGEFIARNVAEINGTKGQPASFDRLDAVLDAQCYRPCNWRAAADEINYRRFFDINELAALCMEDPIVFFQSHRLVLRLLGEGDIAGLRIDHIDGLYAPEQYLWRLQWAYLAELARRLAVDAAQARQPPGPAIDDVTWLHVAPTIVAGLCHSLGLPEPANEDWIAVLGAEPATEKMLPVNGQPELPLPRAERTIPLFVVVEKILGPHEPLPDSWPIAGTTGYDFLQMCDGLFLASDGWQQLKRDYARTTGQAAPFAAVAQDSKRLILRVAMASELQMLAHRLNHISEQHRQSRDFTLNMLRYALREILVCFPVYRIYPDSSGISPRDRQFVNQAVAVAKRSNPAIDASVFDFIRNILLLEHPQGLSPEAIHERELFAGRFQQVTSPVMAKGVEDTSFYVYCPLLSVNEVGNGPESPVVSAEEFHGRNHDRARRWPHAMLASSTHDTKRSEDVRSRLHVLSEMPRPWRSAVQRWMRLNRRRRSEVDGLPAPSRNEEYLFFQSLLGIWPPLGVASEPRPKLIERMTRYMEKAGHEAKQRTSWINPNEAYDRAVRDFVATVLTDRPDNRFVADFLRYQERVAQLGLVNALAQLVLKLTSPGFPDLYQGQEVWSFRLVDPDNRAAVDFSHCQALLADLNRAAGSAGERLLSLARQLAANLVDPRSKLFVTWRLLALRERLGDFFALADYEPLRITGPKAEHALAFARLSAPVDNGSERAVIVVVPRLIARLTESALDGEQPFRMPLGAEAWLDTTLEVPAAAAGALADVFTGARRTLGSKVLLAELFGDFPVAVLERA